MSHESPPASRGSTSMGSSDSWLPPACVRHPSHRFAACAQPHTCDQPTDGAGSLSSSAPTTSPSCNTRALLKERKSSWACTDVDDVRRRPPNLRMFVCTEVADVTSVCVLFVLHIYIVPSPFCVSSSSALCLKALLFIRCWDWACARTCVPEGL